MEARPPVMGDCPIFPGRPWGHLQGVVQHDCLDEWSLQEAENNLKPFLYSVKKALMEPVTNFWHGIQSVVGKHHHYLINGWGRSRLGRGASEGRSNGWGLWGRSLGVWQYPCLRAKEARSAELSECNVKIENYKNSIAVKSLFLEGFLLMFLCWFGCNLPR